MDITRSELYERVWAKPVIQVAAEMGVSGVAIGKACRKHSIPVPGRGYWALKQHGYKVKQQPLKRLSDGTDPIVRIGVFGKTRQAPPPPLSPEREQESQPER